MYAEKLVTVTNVVPCDRLPFYALAASLCAMYQVRFRFVLIISHCAKFALFFIFIYKRKILKGYHEGVGRDGFTQLHILGQCISHP